MKETTVKYYGAFIGYTDDANVRYLPRLWDVRTAALVCKSDDVNAAQFDNEGQARLAMLQWCNANVYGFSAIPVEMQLDQVGVLKVTTIRELL